MITLYGMSSPNVMKVLLLLEELALPYDFRLVDIWAQEQFTESFTALNPNSKVPVIVDPDGPGGRPITVFESGAILLYLAEKAGAFIPPEPGARYACLQWLMLQMGSIGPMFGQATHFRRNKPPGHEYALSRYVTEAKRLADVLQVRLAQSAYLAGDDYSVADMAAYPWLSMYWEVNGIAMASLPDLKRWLDAIAARPASLRVAQAWTKLGEETLGRRAQAQPDALDRLFGRGRYARD